ncbi:MAG TPA: peptidylprolyl isomerase, partial [Gaiellaceae bacterium]|nr:peptidylprolyl isomerase [Gaiellaceae bacterium]
VAGGQSLEQAAQANGLSVEKTPAFSRTSTVPGLGNLNEAIGAAFGLPVGAVSAPVKAVNGVFVIRVDRRVNADSAAFVAQKAAEREQILQTLRQQRVRDYLEGLRKTAKISDHRKELNAAARQTPVS